MAKKHHRRLYIAGLSIALGGFILDRTLLSGVGLGPESAAAAQTSAASKDAAETAKEPAPLVPPLTVLAASLRERTGTSRVDFANLADPFHSASLPGTDGAGTGSVDPVISQREKEFRDHHRLSGVTRLGDITLAIIEGVGPDGEAKDHRLTVGGEIDGFKLVGVDGRTATFRRGDLKVELRLEAR
jgi:hypothetical protein